MHEGPWALPRHAASRRIAARTPSAVRGDRSRRAIVSDLGTISTVRARRALRTVKTFLIRPEGSGSTDQHDNESDRVEWFPVGEALRLMTYRNEAIIVRRAIAAIEAQEDAA
jgi:hypothetical protein